MFKQVRKTESVQDEITFGAVAEAWLDNNKLRLKGGSISKYRNIIDTHIAPQLGQYMLSEISSSFINSYLNQKLISGRLDKKGGLSPSYVNSIRVVISSVIRFAVNEELMSPLRTGINKPAMKKQDLLILSKKEQQILENNLISNINCTNLGILLSLRTGLRIGEICALKWEDIDLNSGIIRVRHTVSRIRCEDSSAVTVLILDDPKTFSSNREIPISKWLTPLVEAVKKTANSEYVISESEGFVSPRTYDYRYHKILESCDIPQVNYHALRHTFATRCVEAGVDIKTLSEILGHSDVSITLNTYVHSSIEMKRNQIEKLTDLMQ